MKTVIMTGATSFLGINVLNNLLQNQYEVYALVRESSKSLSKLPASESLHLIYGTLDELKLIEEYVTSADYFLHFAWDGSGNAGRADATVQFKNVDYAMNALEIAYNLGCEKFIFPGSQAEYGQKYDVIKETDSCNPVSEYGKAKLSFSSKAHKFCKDKTMAFIHLRIFSVYGFGDREGTLVDLCVNKFMKNENIELGPCSQKWNFLYIDDFVNLIEQILMHDVKTGIYNIAGSDTRVLKEFVKNIHDVLLSESEVRFGEMTTNPEGSPSLMPSIDKIISIIGEYTFTPFEAGIQSIIEKKLKEV